MIVNDDNGGKLFLWLTDEKHLALFPGVTIVKDPHHHEFLTERERERERER